MPQFINTNVMSLNAQRNLNTSQSSLTTSLERLSSGLRINSARDDAAGLAISDRLTSQIRGLNQAVRNANDGISLAQTAEGALQESTNILQRMRELSIQSANGSNSGSDRAALQLEVAQLQQELTRIAETTTFGGRNLLDGSFSGESFQVGSIANETIDVSIRNAAATNIGAHRVNAAGTGLGAVEAAAAGGSIPASTVAFTATTIAGNLGSAALTYSALDSARTIAGQVNSLEAQTGVSAEAVTRARLSGFTATGTHSFDLASEGGTTVSISVNITNTGDLQDLADAINAFSATTNVTAVSNGSTVDLTNTNGDDITFDVFEQGTADDGTGQFTVTALNFDGTATTAETTNLVDAAANATESTRITGQLRLSGAAAFAISGGDATVLPAGSSTFTTVDTVDIGTAAGAQSAVSILDAAIQGIDTQRATLGAVQNRLAATISNLQSVSENASASRSRIQDADFAAETAQLSRNQILQQAGIAMLAQANAAPQNVLSLLQ
jgi:flagellin